MSKKSLDGRNYKRWYEIENLSVYSIGFYILTVFIFNADVRLNSISQLAFLFMVGCCFLYVLSSSGNVIFGKALLWGGLVLFLSALSYFWAIDKNLAFKKIITIAQLVVLFMSIYIVIDTRKKINTIINCIILSGYLMYFYMFVTIGIKETIVMFSDGLRVGGETNQENTFGYYSAIVFILSLYQLLYKKQKKYLFLLPMPVIMGLLSGSKKSLLLLVLATLLLITFKNRKRIFTSLLISLVIIVSAGVVLNQFGFFNLVFGRINDAIGGNDGSTESRLQFISFGWQKFLDKPLLGYGVEQFEVLYSKEFLTRHPSHNNYIQLLTSFGVIGLVVWYSAYIYVLGIGVKNFYRDNLAPIITLLAITTFVNDITTTTLINKFTYILLAISFAVCEIIIKEQKRVKK